MNSTVIYFTYSKLYTRFHRVELILLMGITLVLCAQWAHKTSITSVNGNICCGQCCKGAIL